LSIDDRRRWLARLKREYEAGNLTATARLVLIELATFSRCRFGIWPSHELLARRARCCVRTVQDALQAARRLGLVDWAAQRVRAAWRSLRASNRYVLKLPAGAVQPGSHGPRRRTTGKSCRGDIQPTEPEASERTGRTVTALLAGTVRRLTAPVAGIARHAAETGGAASVSECQGVPNSPLAAAWARLGAAIAAARG
jgi:hypothetical protein